MLLERIKDFLIKRPIRINKENEHKVILRRGFLAALSYSIFYGFFEYFIVYNNYVGLLRIYANIFGAEQTLGGAIINWSIMYGCLLITVAIATYYNKKLNFEQILMIVIPLISYIYCLLLLIKNNWNLIEA